MLPTLFQRLFLTASGIALIVAPSTCAQAQPHASRPAFDVASVKPSQSTDYWATVAPWKNGRFSGRNVTVKLLLSIAYKVDVARISGGPSWLDSERFDVEAKCDGSAPDQDLSLMLQSLLEARFRLRLHKETKVASRYALVIASNGTKIRPVEPRDCPATGKGLGCVGVRFGGRGLTAEYVSMPVFAGFLAGMLGNAVIDETGLKGAFDFRLEWVRDSVDGGGGTSESSVDWVSSALPQQLGLKLEAKKASIEMLVIDGIEKPTAN